MLFNSRISKRHPNIKHSPTYKWCSRGPSFFTRTTAKVRLILKHLRTAIQDAVQHITMKSPSKSDELGPLPKDLVKKDLENLLCLITAIINKSEIENDVLVYF